MSKSPNISTFATFLAIIFAAGTSFAGDSKMTIDAKNNTVTNEKSGKITAKSNTTGGNSTTNAGVLVLNAGRNAEVKANLKNNKINNSGTILSQSQTSGGRSTTNAGVFVANAGS